MLKKTSKKPGKWKEQKFALVMLAEEVTEEKDNENGAKWKPTAAEGNSAVKTRKIRQTLNETVLTSETARL